MPTYDLGDGVNLENLVYNRDNALTDATVALTITKPNGSTASPSISHPATGTYLATVVTDQTGPWVAVWSVTGTVTDVKVVTWTVADPAPPAYADLEIVKTSLGKWTDDDKDDLVQQAIVAASRMIDRRTGRRFYADRTATARTFPVIGQSGYVGCEQYALVDDIASLDDLAVATGSTALWTPVATFGTGPDNALAYGRPITQILGTAGWLPATGRIQVTARWGWPSIPDEIAHAATLLSARLYRRKDSPNGVIGSADWGQIRVSRTDPDVEALIGPFVIPTIA